MKTKILIGVVFVLALAVTLAATAGADDGSMFNWYDPCGYTCYQWADGSGDCYPCLEGCDETPIPAPTPKPTEEPTKGPTEEPTPPPTKEPTEEPKPKCNRGLGNGSEGCDPGNSGGKPGAAGEDNE